MKTFRAKHAGACYGVKRALEAAERVVEQANSAFTMGPLIHNPKVVASFEQRGIKVAADVEDIDGGVIIIRSHGITPGVRAALEKKNLDIVDATCPHVARAQNAAAELAQEGCRVVVVGEAGHPEVEGLCAYVQAAGGKFDVVASSDDVPADLYDPVGVVVQTTQKRENLDAVVSRLEAMGLSPLVRNTICSATSQRQKTAAQLADKVEAMVVIGGRNSSNTTRLAEICSEHCPCVYHIEEAAELDAYANQLCAYDAVGVTAGASTPEGQIKEVVDYLEAL